MEVAACVFRTCCFQSLKKLRMGSSFRRENIRELGAFLADRTSRALAKPMLAGAGKLKSFKLLAGHEWGKRTMRHVKARKLPGIIREFYST